MIKFKHWHCVYLRGKREEDGASGSSKTELRKRQIFILVKHSLTYWPTLTPHLEIIRAKPTGIRIAKNPLTLNHRAA